VAWTTGLSITAAPAGRARPRVETNAAAASDTAAALSCPRSQRLEERLQVWLQGSGVVCYGSTPSNQTWRPEAVSPQIDVDQEVLEFLKRNAEPFVDTTPNTVLRRLLFAGGSGRAAAARPAAGRASGAGDSSTALPAKKTPKSKKVTQPRTRAAAGSLLPEERYELPLLAALVDLGGRAPYREVLESVGKRIDSELTDLDRDKLASGGIRWQSRLQFVRLRLIERGLLERDSPRGVWGISDAGRAAVEKGDTK
jgi:hypothetical protein